MELTVETKDKRLNRLVALTVVILSVTMGLGNIKDGNIVQAMAQAQADSLDTWNEYQATRTKLHIVETARVELAASVDPAKAVGGPAGFDAETAKYKAETPRLAKAAPVRPSERTVNSARWGSPRSLDRSPSELPNSPDRRPPDPL